MESAKMLGTFTRRGAVRLAAALPVILLAACGAGSGGDGPGPSPAGWTGGDDDRTALLVRGRIRPDELVLEPVLRTTAPPSLPDIDGRHRLRGEDREGAALFEFGFDATPVADLPGGPEEHFAFVVPVSEAEAQRLYRIELRAADGRSTARTARFSPAEIEAALQADAVAASRVDAQRVRVQWDAERFAMVMIRDPGSGAILSFARGGDITVFAPGTTVEVTVSDGVQSQTRTVPVR